MSDRITHLDQALRCAAPRGVKVRGPPCCGERRTGFGTWAVKADRPPGRERDGIWPAPRRPAKPIVWRDNRTDPARPRISTPFRCAELAPSVRHPADTRRRPLSRHTPSARSRASHCSWTGRVRIEAGTLYLSFNTDQFSIRTRTKDCTRRGHRCRHRGRRARPRSRERQSCRVLRRLGGVIASTVPTTKIRATANNGMTADPAHRRPDPVRAASSVSVGPCGSWSAFCKTT
jgi:hypothetical protein